MDSSPELDIERLVWDDWNRSHIARHGVTPDEVAEVCFGEPVFHDTYKGRVMVIGRGRGGRMITMILGATPGRPGTYYTFTARPASRQERRRYREARGEQP